MLPPLAHFLLSLCWRHFSIRLVYKLQYSAVPELPAQEIAQLGARIHPELLSIKLFALFQVEMWELNLFGSSLDHGRAHMQGLEIALNETSLQIFTIFLWNHQNLLSSIRPHSCPPDIWISPLKRFCIELVRCGFRPKKSFMCQQPGQRAGWLISAEQN